MNYETKLRQNSLKVTPQRLGMLRLIEKNGHIAIEELYAKIKRDFASISLATLYKNVHALIDAKILKEVKVPMQKSRYELVKEPHAHLMCQQCGSFEDVHIDLHCADDAVKKEGFTPLQAEVTFIGLCHDCAQ